VKRTGTQERTDGAADTSGPAQVPPLARPALEPVRTRRRPLMVGLGVALTALGGLGAAWLVSTGARTVSVLGVSNEIHAGQVIHRQDLVSVQIAAGSGLSALPVARAEEVIGKRTLVRLLPGSLLNPDAVADKIVPGSGEALLGLSLGPGQRPAVPLDTGDSVEIVYTGGAQDQSTAGTAQPEPVPAVVVTIRDDPDTGKAIVDVTVPVDVAAKIATWASAGRATVVLLSAVRA
jgi:SAF domain